ncbi:MAG TPA: alanine racemase, partial [Acidimicrobiales bacterium]|nr:alanine racemase [Acidimicrobiales bacterium]
QPGEVPGVVSGLLALGCRVDGLMTVAPPGDATVARAAFDLVARLRDELGLAELSMGMSDDLEQAVAAGATMVRLGTALFGPRPQRRRL